MSLEQMLDNLDSLPRYEDGDLDVGSAALICYNVNTFPNNKGYGESKVQNGIACGFNIQWIMLLGVPRPQL